MLPLLYALRQHLMGYFMIYDEFALYIPYLY